VQNRGLLGRRFVLKILLTIIASFTLGTTAIANEKLKFELLNGNEQACQDLAQTLQENVELTADAIPSKHPAGTVLSFQFSIDKSMQLDSEKWFRQASDVSFSSIIEQPYSKAVHHKPAPDLTDFFFEEDNFQTFDIETEVAANIGGRAKHRITFWLQSKIPFEGRDFSFCLVGAILPQTTEIQSDNVDITPPLLRVIKYDQRAYRQGESATINFTFTEPLKDAESDHITFTNRMLEFGDISRAFPEYNHEEVHKLTKVSDNEYSFTFTIPEYAKPGRYHLEFFNRQDKFGNFEGNIGREDALEKKVADTSPLVIVEE